MASAAPIIEVRDLVAGYGSHKVLEGLSFDVRPGEIFFVLGGSGSGKSTILKHLIGLNPALGGSIRIAGDELCGADSKTRRRILTRIGVTYQQGALFGSMTLGQNIRLPLEELTTLPGPAMDEIARLKLSLVGLGEFVDYLPDEISGGMQKRAAIARAMALDPEIMFLDEPSAGLDPITAADLDALIRDLSHNLGITFVIVSHELASIYAIADRVIMVDRQTRGIIAEGSPAELRDHSKVDRVQRFFNRIADPVEPRPKTQGAAV